MQNNTAKLDQLTSLRFFAALMIVIHHSTGLFGIKNVGVNFGQGVSFFFVLSGFILTYVYPQLENWYEIKKFWKARIARIWPAYLACLLIGFWLIPYNWNALTAVPYLLMVQAWIPESAYYFSYNAASWSISTEMFFYLAFPLLLYQWNKSWLLKLVFSGALLIVLIAVTNNFSLPNYGDPGTGSDGFLVSKHGLLYINPLSRIFEFIFGMCVARAWRNSKSTSSVFSATLYELSAIVLCGLSMYYGSNITQWCRENIFLGASVAQWFMHSGSFFAFGLLIYVIAQGRGIFSKILANSFLVLLGEISYSLYLIHQILLTLYRQHGLEFQSFSNSIAFACFIGILLLSSYLIWSCIEMPARKIILGHSKIHSTIVMRKSWRENLASRQRPLLAGIILICIITTINLFTSHSSHFEYLKASKNHPSKISSEFVNTEICQLDLINNISAEKNNLVENKARVKLSGWAGDINTGTTPQAVWVELVGSETNYVKAIHGIKRPDVAKYYNKPNLTDAGYEAYADLSSLVPGKYDINIVMAYEKISFKCYTNRSVNINL
jgi:peptidoglycan/LPS O-acetylase OafA/YrhL